MGYDPAIVATKVEVRDRVIHLDLADGSTHSFPSLYFPRLANAPDELLSRVLLRAHGKALRWEELDEDIWIGHAVLGRYPVFHPPPSPPSRNPSHSEVSHA
jgi:hypothetical protein